MDDVQEKQMLFKFLSIKQIGLVAITFLFCAKNISAAPTVTELSEGLKKRAEKVQITTDYAPKKSLNATIDELQLRSKKIKIDTNNSYKINPQKIKEMSEKAKQRASTYFETNELTVFNEKIPGLKKSKITKPSNGRRLYIFISESVPMETIRRYVLDAYKIRKFTNVSILLSGGIKTNRTIKPTIQFVFNATKIDKNCKGIQCKRYNIDVLIDPVLFNRYKINKVPAFVLADLETIKSYCSEGSSQISVKEYDIVYGDATITAALNYFSEKKHNTYSKTLLEKVKNVIW